MKNIWAMILVLDFEFLLHIIYLISNTVQAYSKLQYLLNVIKKKFIQQLCYLHKQK